MRRTLPSFRALCWAGFAVTVTVVGVAKACLWDYDTLKAEAAGLPGIVEIITGRFDRFPPLYYEMRLERVAGEIEAGATDLELYDNAGVACDRLGRYDEAIEWMARKLAVIEAIESAGGDTGEHRYRYLANLGTFHVHRWLAGGADRSDMSDVERSRDLIAEAIEVNPDAHFGREKYQLRAILWIIERPDEERWGWYDSTSFLDLDEAGGEKLPQLAKWGEEPDEAVQGVAGMISLGAGWESVDMFNALAVALTRRDDNVLGTLARLRQQELLDAGGHSLWPIREDADLYVGSSLVGTTANRVRSYYPRARAEADGWRAARQRFMLDKLSAGLHPDTHAGFWDDWVEPSQPPTLPGHGPYFWGGIIAALGLAAIIMRKQIGKFMTRLRRESPVVSQPSPGV